MHIFAFSMPAEAHGLATHLTCVGAHRWRAGRLVVVVLPAQRVVRASVKNQSALETPLNFVRFYLHELLPSHFEHALYLDADVIVRADLTKLWAHVPSHDNWVCAAVPRPSKTLGGGGMATLRGAKGAFFGRYGVALNLSAKSINAGILLLNIRSWARLGLTKEVEFWVRENNAKGLYHLGSQPPLELATHGRRLPCVHLPPEWHVGCLGCDSNVRPGKKLVRKAKILHWNGPCKPWLSPPPSPSGRIDVWRAYAVKRCYYPHGCGTENPCTCSIGNGPRCERR